MKRIQVLAAIAVTAICPLAPVHAQVAVISDAVVERAATPGQTYQGRLLLQNTTSEPQEARIYQTDYTFTADGRTLYGSAGSTMRSNAKWIAVSPTYVSIPPDATVPVNYTVTVPADSSLRGSFWSLIMVEPIQPGSAQSRKPKTGQVGLSITTRSATQIATHIGTSGVTKLAFDSLTATSTPEGARGLRFDFINTGERANRYTMSLELYNEAGELVKKATQTRGLLYPGTAARQSFDVGTVPHGAYTAVLVADGGGEQVFGGQFKVTY